MKKALIILLSVFVVVAVATVVFLIKQKVTVSFDTDGGSSVNAISIKKGDSVTLPETKKEGFVFNGWYLNDEKIENTKTYDEDVTLKAKWEKEIETYSITFDSNGGSSVESIKVECGKELKLPENPTRSGYSFMSWVDQNERPILDQALLACEDITLKANWEKTSYTVTFDSYGGSKVESIQVECGKELRLPKNPTRSGYSFVSWVDQNERSILDQALLTCEDITLKAYWEKQ